MAQASAVADATGALARYEQMLLIRGFLERCKGLHDRGEIRGSIHLGIGQEAIAVGVCSALDGDDAITATYRGHAHAIAKGTPVNELLAEMCGRETGCCSGLGGSLHLADARVSHLGANAIVGGAVPMAVGAALARLMDGGDRVAATFFGEGATNQGALLESLNLAAVWNLPILFVCENNQYSEMTPAADMIASESLAARAAAFGMPARREDGMDVEKVRAVALEAIGELRRGAGPVFVEFETYRFSGHYHGDPETIRSPEEIESWRPRDPIAQAQRQLESAGLTEEAFAAARARVERELDDAERFALASPRPGLALLESLGWDGRAVGRRETV